MTEPLQLCGGSGAVEPLFGREPGSQVYGGLADPDLEDDREAGAFEGLAGFGDTPAALSGGASADGAVVTWLSLVTEEYFGVVRPRAQIGRLLHEGDISSVVLYDAPWHSRFGGDRCSRRRGPAERHAFEIVGVAERGLHGNATVLVRTAAVGACASARVDHSGQ